MSVDWKATINARLKEEGTTSIGEDDLYILAGDTFRILGMVGGPIPSAEEIIGCIEGVEIVRFKKYWGLIPDHFLDHEECVKATSEEKAVVDLAKKFRHKINSLSEKELIEYLGLLAFEKEE